MTETDKYAPSVSTTATPTESVESAPPVADAPSWRLDDNTPGHGPRPDWLPAKYQKVSDVAKAYSEAEKRLGAFTGAPESYDLSSLELDGDAHIVKELTTVAKEMNMNQEGLQKFLGRLATASETVDAMHLDEQVKAMGSDGARMLTEYKNWTKDYLRPEEVEVVKEWVKSADDLKVFNRMMANTHMSAVPTANDMSRANKFEGVKELRNEMVKNIARYDTDKAYQKDWSLRMARAVERDPNS